MEYFLIDYKQFQKALITHNIFTYNIAIKR
jgi:hypothetical protein